MARQDIGYDFEDFGMTENALEQKYGHVNEHPVYNRVTHQAYLAMPTRDVKLAYWNWVVKQIKKDDDAIEGAPVPSDPAARLAESIEDPDMILVESIDQFAHYVANWHAHKMHNLRHFLDMPEGQTVTVRQGDIEKPIVLEGVVLEAFKAAILTATMIFDSLPFAVSVDDAIDTPAAGEPDADAPKH